MSSGDRLEINLQPQLPRQVGQAANVTTSPYILRSRYENFYPDQQASYTTNGMQEIRVRVSTQDQFLDMQKSYFRFKIATKLLIGGQPDANRHFGKAGVHSIFESVRVRSATGTVLAECNNYKTLAPIILSTTAGQELLKSTGAPSGVWHTDDQVYRSNEYEPFLPLLDWATALSTWTLDTKRLVIAHTEITGLGIGVGDLVRFGETSGVPQMGYVTEMNWVSGVSSEIYLSDSSPLQTDKIGNLTSADLGTTLINYIQVAKQRIYRGSSSYAANHLGGADTNVAALTDTTVGAYTEVVFNPLLGFTNQMQWLAAFVMDGGVYFELKLHDKPEITLTTPSYSSSASGAFSGAEMRIKDVRYIAHLIQANDTLRQTYHNLYRDGGITHRYINYFHKRDNDVNTTNSINRTLNVGKRGVRYMFLVQQDDRSVTTNIASSTHRRVNTYNYSCGTFQRMKLDKYEVRALSMRFPQDQEIDMTTDNALNEPLQILKSVVGAAGLGGLSISPYEWRSENIDGASVNESSKFIIAIQLGKSNEPHTGLDLKRTHVNYNLTYSGDHKPDATDALISTRYLNFFFAYDTIMVLNKAHNVTVFD